MTTEYLKQNTSDYCIMLPFVEKKKENFSNQYAVVFDDWDVIDEHGGKNLTYSLLERIQQRHQKD